MDKIHVAAAEGLKEELVALSTQTDMTEGDDIGVQAIHHAALNGHADCVAYLLGLGISPSRRTLQRHTPLHLAAAMGHLGVIDVLLNGGASIVEVDHDGWTPLHHAAHHGRTEAVALLLQRGAPVDSKNFLLCTPLHVACLRGQKPVIVQLLMAGGQYDYDAPLIKPIDYIPKPPAPTSFDQGSTFEDSGLGKELCALLHDPHAHADVTFSCSDGARLQAHKCILAVRAPHLLERASSDDALPVTSEQLHAVLNYVYGGSLGEALLQGTPASREVLERDTKLLVGFMEAAQVLGLTELRRMAQRSVIMRIGGTAGTPPLEDGFAPYLELLSRVLPHASLMDADMALMLGFFVANNFSALMRYYDLRHSQGQMATPKETFVRAMVAVIPVELTSGKLGNLTRVVARPARWKHWGVPPMQAEHKELMSALVTTIKNDKLASTFEYPVSAINPENPLDQKSTIADYWAIVMFPLHLEAVTNRLDSDWYVAPLEIINDLRLAFCNAMRYNDEGSAISEHAAALYFMTGQLYSNLEEQFRGLYPEPVEPGNLENWIDVKDPEVVSRVQHAFATGVPPAPDTRSPAPSRSRKSKNKGGSSKRSRKELRESDWRPLPAGGGAGGGGGGGAAKRKAAAPKKAKQAPPQETYQPPPPMPVPAMAVPEAKSPEEAAMDTVEERTRVGADIQRLEESQAMPLFQIIQSRGNDGLVQGPDGDVELDLNSMTVGTLLECRKYLDACLGTAPATFLG